jgi:hypothetical protein
MAILADAIDDLFADPNLARDAVWRPAVGDPVPIRIMLRQPDEVASFGESRFATDTTVIDIRVTEVAEPRPGDRIDIDGELLLVQGEPRRDAERLVWRIEAVPA